MMDEYICKLITVPPPSGSGFTTTSNIPAMMASSSSSALRMHAPGQGSSAPCVSISNIGMGLSQSQLSQASLPVTFKSPDSGLVTSTLASTHNQPTTSGTANSVLTADISPMIAWINAQAQRANESQSQSFSSAGSSQHLAYESEASRIPKPYIEMSQKDCASTVAKSIRNVVLHTCNDEFRQQCYQKLGVTSSLDVERVIRKRLGEMLLQQSRETATICNPILGGESANDREEGQR